MKTEGLTWTAHPILDREMPALSPEEIRRVCSQAGGMEVVLDYWQEREDRIRRSLEDPLNYGFDLPMWADCRDLLRQKDEVLVLGGNGSSKTELGGKMAVEVLQSAGGKFVLCVTTNEDLSRQKQQAAIWKYLPPVYRAPQIGPRKRSRTVNVNYGQKGGFTENTFVLANKSQCWFKTREQYERQPTSFEGPEYDFIHLDEPMPLGLLQTLRFRAAKRAGKILLTFTAIDGFDAVCKDVITGAKVVRSLPMNWAWNIRGARGEGRGTGDGWADPSIKIPELDFSEVQVAGLPPGHMPYILQPLDFRKAVICFWSHWNLFQPWQKILDACVGRPKSFVRCRGFGWTEKMSGCQFPNFNPSVHIIPPEKVPVQGTDYQSVDPAVARSYFAIWARVDPLGRVFIYDESPRKEEGEWVTSDEEKGEGQTVYAGKGINWYKRHFRERERQHGMGEQGNDGKLEGWKGDRTPARRIGDPRGFATQAAAKDGGSSLMEEFGKEDVDDPENPETAGMVFEPAKVRARIAFEIEKVNDLLAYDPDKPIVCMVNEPRLYVSSRCQNLIRCMLNWAPDQGEDSPWKDPVDALRYLVAEPLYYQDPGVPEVVGGGGW